MYDVAIIGGGVSGCSLLYALARYRLRVLLLEKTNDVGVATTKANSAILHAGYDPAPGTQMARYNVRGNTLTKQICRDLDILMKEAGSFVVGFDAADKTLLQQLYQRGVQNGVPGLELLDATAAHVLEPNLAPEVIMALHAPSAAVVNPWELAFAQAETAIKNGAEVWLDAAVTGIQNQGESFLLATTAGPVQTRFVVNAAGVQAADIANLAAPAGFTITPVRGQYYLLDKSQGELVSRTIFQCPTPLGKGVLVSPTVHGNLIVGPDSEHANSLATTAVGLAYVRQMALRSAPDIQWNQSIRNFAGLRAEADTGDFVIGPHPAAPGFFNIAGIKSPGLTAATAIAEAMVDMLGAAGLPLTEKDNFENRRQICRFNHLNEKDRALAVARNPLYGRIVCRCETVTEGEVVDALRRPLPPRSLDAVKRRVGPGMGRCQGGFCGPRVQEIIARELGLAQCDIPQDRAGMQVVTGRTKGKAGCDKGGTET